MSAFWAIVYNTFRETVRQPVFALVMVVGTVLIGISPALSGHIYTFSAGSGLKEPAERMMADLGLATVLMAGLIITVVSTSSVISREITNKTALSVLTKQISRASYVFAKYFGVAGAISLAVGTMIVFVLLTVRVGGRVYAGEPVDNLAIIGMIAVPAVSLTVATFRNYFQGKSWLGNFTISYLCMTLAIVIVFGIVDRSGQLITTASPELSEDLQIRELQIEREQEERMIYDWDVARAGVLTLLGVLVLAAVSVAASTRLDTGGNVMITGIAFVGGLTSEFLVEQAMAPGGAYWIQMIATAWQRLLPNMQLYYMSDAITREIPIPMEYVYMTAGYTAVMCLAYLCLAAVLFEKREIS